MKIPRAGVAAVVSLLALMGAAVAADQAKAAARATAEFVSPEKFTDFRESILDSEKERQSLIERFSEHVAKLGEQCIPEGQRLEIRFKNIDLAGDFEPWRGPDFDDIRIMKDIYIPRIELEYRLVDAKSGAVIREGAERLSNMSYMLMVPRTTSNEALRHDFELLGEWMRREFRKSK